MSFWGALGQSALGQGVPKGRVPLGHNLLEQRQTLLFKAVYLLALGLIPSQTSLMNTTDYLLFGGRGVPMR